MSRPYHSVHKTTWTTLYNTGLKFFSLKIPIWIFIGSLGGLVLWVLHCLQPCTCLTLALVACSESSESGGLTGGSGFGRGGGWGWNLERYNYMQCSVNTLMAFNWVSLSWILAVFKSPINSKIFCITKILHPEILKSNSLWPSHAISRWCHTTCSTLVQARACHLFSASPLPEPMLWMDP